MNIGYKIIQLPYPLNFKEMSKHQAQGYLQWFREQIPERIQILFHYIKLSPGYEDLEPDLTPSSLEKLGKWFVEHVSIRKGTQAEIEFIYANAPEWFRQIEIPEYELTEQTFSLSMDIGMYVSQVLEKNIKGLHWEVGAKPIKNVDFQQPVLSGLGKLVFNPVHIIITYAYGIVNHNKGSERLKELYEIWANILSSEF